MRGERAQAQAGVAVMTTQHGGALRFLVTRLGWWGILLLVLSLAGVGAGLWWEQQRRPPIPAGAEQVTSSLIADLRQTSFRHPGTATEIQAFYREALAARGWQYCGTQATPGCTNLTKLVDRPEDALDVYRRTDDTNNRGPTLEIWPLATENGQTFVTIYETRGR
jgi:hypothetical protein